MNARPILLGITGNIASGKSAVRQYLENEGALTIDADLLAQSTYFPGGPAYQPI
jgi:dephospho-CoA kinase